MDDYHKKHVYPVSDAFGKLLEPITTRGQCGSVLPDIRKLCVDSKAADPEIEVLELGPPMSFMYSSREPHVLVNIFILILKLRADDGIQSIVCHKALKDEPDFILQK